MPARNRKLSPYSLGFYVTFKYLELIGWFAVISNIGHYEIMFGSFLHGKFCEIFVPSFIYLFFMCMGVPCTCCTHGSWKRGSGPLDLELQTVESCNVGAGNQTWMSKSSQCSYLLQVITSITIRSHKIFISLGNHIVVMACSVIVFTKHIYISLCWYQESI